MAVKQVRFCVINKKQFEALPCESTPVSMPQVRLCGCCIQECEAISDQSICMAVGYHDHVHQAWPSCHLAAKNVRQRPWRAGCECWMLVLDAIKRCRESLLGCRPALFHGAIANVGRFHAAGISWLGVRSQEAIQPLQCRPPVLCCIEMHP